MTLVCLGVSHKTAPVEVRERFAFSERDLAAALGEVRALDAIEEVVVVSTCNRVEIYAAAKAGPAGLGELESYLRAKIECDGKARDIFYRLSGREAVSHLFRVVSGLDSMVLGETEVFGQVKKAYAGAHHAGTTSRMLNRLFQQAFQVGKMVRTSTRITRGSTSVGSVAVDLAGKIFGALKRCEVMVIGAGETSRRTAQSLMSRGAKSMIVSNRSYDRAVELAEEMHGEAVRFDEWDRVIAGVDIVITSTAAPHTLIDESKVRAAMRRRRGRPLFVIDIAVPRDVDPAVNDVESVYLYDIDELEEIAADGRRERERQIAVCDDLIREQVEACSLPGLGGGSRGEEEERNADDDDRLSDLSPAHE